MVMRDWVERAARMAPIDDRRDRAAHPAAGRNRPTFLLEIGEISR